MVKSNNGGIKRGQTISFRVPSDTPDHLLKYLQQLREKERRNFSGTIAEYVLQGLGTTYAKQRESITIPLPNKLSKAQRDWLKHEHSEALLGSIVYNLLSDPVRTTALLGALNSNSLDIDEALYLQEDPEPMDEATPTSEEQYHPGITEQRAPNTASDGMKDDLDTFDWEKAKQNQQQPKVEEDVEQEEDLEDLLGDFLASMNK